MSKKSKAWTTDYVNRIVAAKAKAANKEILRMTEICLVCGWDFDAGTGLTGDFENKELSFCPDCLNNMIAIEGGEYND